MCIRDSTKVLKTRKKEIIHHLILPGNRLDKLRMFINMVNQAICVFAHTEEIRLFLRRLNLTAAVRTFAVNQLRLCKKGFAGSTVKPLIIAFVNVALIVQFLKYLDVYKRQAIRSS